MICICSHIDSAFILKRDSRNTAYIFSIQISTSLYLIMCTNMFEQICLSSLLQLLSMFLSRLVSLCIALSFHCAFLSSFCLLIHCVSFHQFVFSIFYCISSKAITHLNLRKQESSQTYFVGSTASNLMVQREVGQYYYKCISQSDIPRLTIISFSQRYSLFN